MRVLVVGGGIAGDSAALTARAGDPEAEITMLTEEAHPLYSACIFGHFLSGHVQREQLFLRTEEDYQRMGIERLTGTRVMGVHPGRRVVALEGSELAYDRLVLATGSAAIVPRIAGASKAGVLAMKSITDLDGLMGRLAPLASGRIGIVGSGPVGCELAVRLASRGHRVYLVERLDRVMPKLLDADLGAVVQRTLEARGIDVFVGEEVLELGGEKNVESICTGERELPCDAICLAVGMRPRTELAREMGIAIGRTGGIVVDDGMETNVAGVYACGDCVESQEAALGEPRLSMLWHTAKWQGYVAGSNSVGVRRTYPGSLSYAIVDTLPGWAGSSGHVREDYGSREVRILDRRTSDCWVRQFMVEDRIAGLQFVGRSVPGQLGRLLGAIRVRTRLSDLGSIREQSMAAAATWRLLGTVMGI